MRTVHHFLLLVFVFPILGGCGFEVVDNGHRGVQTRLSKVDETIGSLPPGLQWYNPFTESVHEIDVRTKVYEEKLQTYTKDVQQAVITVKVNYRPVPAEVHKLFQEVRIGDIQNTLLLPALSGDLKKIIGQYEAVELIDKRGKATSEVEKSLRESLRKKYIDIERVELVNIDYTKEFEHAVEEKVVAAQDAIKEANKTKQVQETNKQRLNTAETEARSVQLRATALQANPKLVEWEYAQAAKEAATKWNGQLPVNMYGSAPVPFLQLPHNGK
jgi:prohibitin 2